MRTRRCSLARGCGGISPFPRAPMRFLAPRALARWGNAAEAVTRLPLASPAKMGRPPLSLSSLSCERKETSPPACCVVPVSLRTPPLACSLLRDLCRFPVLSRASNIVQWFKARRERGWKSEDFEGMSTFSARPTIIGSGGGCKRRERTGGRRTRYSSS